ncbi:hypothetical protein [Psychrobacter sp. I-STPA10]|uniref:hypothetical protein n=1 Tax=Psychrobacter sp. I-STPA10 TaxID=2585769 RepID=UPI001E298FB1|nr:hypothetical protein [Psychrobacter sp. I-STPA10]
MQPSIHLFTPTFDYQNIFDAYPTKQQVYQSKQNHLSDHKGLTELQTEKTECIWLAKSKQRCLQLCQQHKLATIEFAHWLAIPDLGLLLVFRQQCCVGVQKGVL